jgi:hydrogenase maturation protease
MEPLAVLGLGNVLMQDDAVGPHVIAALRDGWSVEAGVEIEELGTPGFDLVPYLAGRDAVVLVDAVNAQAPPGTVRVYRRDELLAHPPGLRLSPHDPALKETLLSLEFSGSAPRDVVLVGVVPSRTGQGTGLSPEVAAAVPRAVAAVLAELERLGVRAVPRPAHERAEVWWETA